MPVTILHPTSINKECDGRCQSCSQLPNCLKPILEANPEAELRANVLYLEGSGRAGIAARGTLVTLPEVKIPVNYQS